MKVISISCLIENHSSERSVVRASGTGLQDLRWNAEQLPGGYVRWTTPSGRQYTTEPTRHPI